MPANRLDDILGACKRTDAVLERLPASRAREPEYDPYEPRPYQYTEQQKKEIAKYGRTLLCRECQDPDAWWDMDSGTPTCSHCGAEDGMVPSDACEKRFFNDDEKHARDAKKRNDEYKDEENFHLSKIQAYEIGGGCSDQDMWSANNRLNQCVVWLEMLTRDQSPGGFRLHPGEVRTGRILLRAVCVQWAKEGFVGDNFGNPVLWAINIALQLVAVRPEGFAMPTEHLCTRVTLQGLHSWLRRYRSDAVFMAYESTLSMTNVRGTDARLGALAAENRVQRHAAFHELGNTPHKRYEKNLVLHKLIVNSGFYGGGGLAPPVLKMHAPKLMGAEQPALRAWAVRRKAVGVDADAAMVHRSDTDTDAESVYEEVSVPASPLHEPPDEPPDFDPDADDELSKTDDGGCCSQRPPLEPAPIPVTEMPYAAENVAVPPGGECRLTEVDQQVAMAVQLADPLAHAALSSAFEEGGDGAEDDRDSNATRPYFLESEGEGEGGGANLFGGRDDGGDDADEAEFAESDALPEDIDLPNDVWEQQVEEERAELDAEEARDREDEELEDIEAAAFAAAEASALDGTPCAPLEPEDEQPPKLRPAIQRKAIPMHKLKTATLSQVRASSQYWQPDQDKAKEFYERWKQESKAHREAVRLRLAEKQQREAAFAKARAEREAKRAAAKANREVKEREREERRESRGWNQFMGQAAKKEMAEARLARGQGVCFVTPTEELNDKKAGTIAKIGVNLVLPPLRLPVLQPAAPLKAVRVKLAGAPQPLCRAPRGKRKAPEEEEAPAPGDDPYARKFKPRRRKE